MHREIRRCDIAASVLAVGLGLAALAGGHEDRGWTILAVTSCALFAWPALIFVHELGHAVVAVAMTGERVMVRMGGEPYLVRFALGKIDVRIHPSGCVAHCQLNSGMSFGGYLMAVLAGPAVSLALGASLFPLAFLWRGSAILFWIVLAVAGMSLLIGVDTAIPRRRPGPNDTASGDPGPTDGLLVLEAVRQRRRGGTVTDESRRDRRPKPPYLMTEQAKRVFAMADQDARSMGALQIGTEHLLLGLLGEEGTHASRVLKGFGLTDERVRGQVTRAEGQGHGPTPEELFPTPAATRVLGHANRALTLQGDERVGTAHLLLGVTQEGEGMAMQVLAELEVDPTHLRREALLTLREERTQGAGPASSAESLLSRSACA